MGKLAFVGNRNITSGFTNRNVSKGFYSRHSGNIEYVCFRGTVGPRKPWLLLGACFYGPKKRSYFLGGGVWVLFVFFFLGGLFGFLLF